MNTWIPQCHEILTMFVFFFFGRTHEGADGNKWEHHFKASSTCSGLVILISSLHDARHIRPGSSAACPSVSFVKTAQSQLGLVGCFKTCLSAVWLSARSITRIRGRAGFPLHLCCIYCHWIWMWEHIICKREASIVIVVQTLLWTHTDTMTFSYLKCWLNSTDSFLWCKMHFYFILSFVFDYVWISFLGNCSMNSNIIENPSSVMGCDVTWAQRVQINFRLCILPSSGFFFS